MNYTLPFTAVGINDVARVGGKNASLGEMIGQLSAKGIRVPGGFAVSADAYYYLLESNGKTDELRAQLDQLDIISLSNLPAIGLACRDIIAQCAIPATVRQAILDAYHHMQLSDVAVRSSATAEDLPSASFAGQHESFLHINGDAQLIEAVHKCYISLFNDRAIKYRIDNGFDHMKVALSVGVQQMIRSDSGSAGVAFTLDPESGFSNVVYITGAWGLGESVVQGAVNPDEFYLFKPAIDENRKALFYHRKGAKVNRMVYAGSETTYELTPEALRDSYVLNDEEVEILGRWCRLIEQHYQLPMDIEWAKDGEDGLLYILQARPETVHAQKKVLADTHYSLNTTAKPVCTGKSVGHSIVSGTARIIRSLADGEKVQAGDIIVADITNPDWNALLRKAVCIVTDKGGRTSHASIVARELGIIAVVGTMHATEVLHDGQVITVSCAGGDAGHVYDGKLAWQEEAIAFDQLPDTSTKAMFILADPQQAFRLSAYPNSGVGLMRMEFAVNNAIGIHPMALVNFDDLPDDAAKVAIAGKTKHYPDKKQYFIDKLSEAVAMVAAAYYPKDVIVRMSDFKSNEYAQLLGGKAFEPDEENPMLGFRGASRYYHPNYKQGFGLECAAIKRVREALGFTNVKVMIPFCRTVDEGKKVIETMREFGLERGSGGLEVYVMAEIPSNVILAREFAEVFDGFSIGSNDLTQLTLGIDRDSAVISPLFDESNPAVTSLLRSVIRDAKAAGKKIGLCGQAPSDRPEFAQFLVQCGIDSISFNADALVKGIHNIAAAEAKLKNNTN